MSATKTGLVSVIMTAFNSQDTIERAVDSVLRQTYRDFELIVVDDGSVDRTRELIASFAEQDERVKLLELLPNAGLSVSRNRALDAANGEWVTFLDSDDEYTPDRLERLLAAADDETDAVVCRHILVIPDGQRRERGSAQTKPLTGHQATLAFLTDRITPYMWDKLYRADKLKDLRWATDVGRLEDVVFNVAASLQLRKLVFVPHALNVYYVLAGSLTWGKVPELATIENALRLMQSSAAPILGSRQALTTHKVLDYLNWFNTALVRLPESRITEAIVHANEHISWADVFIAMPRRMYIGLAAALLKMFPSLYALAYRRFAGRTYGIE